MFGMTTIRNREETKHKPFPLWCLAPSNVPFSIHHLRQIHGFGEIHQIAFMVLGRVIFHQNLRYQTGFLLPSIYRGTCRENDIAKSQVVISLIVGSPIVQRDSEISTLRSGERNSLFLCTSHILVFRTKGTNDSVMNAIIRHL